MMVIDPKPEFGLLFDMRAFYQFMERSRLQKFVVT